MAQKFDAQVKGIVAKNKEALLILFQQSCQDVVDVMQLPVAKGGRMRVDTGFLRASLEVSLNQPFSGFTQRPDIDDTFKWNETEVALTLNNAKLGDAFYAVYTAEYAAAREYGTSRGGSADMFVRGAASQWQQIVRKNVGIIRARLG